MKASNFNTFFTYEGNKIGYNSFTSEFILLDELLFDMYSIGSKKGDFLEMKEIHHEFYDFLIKQGFLVNSSENEFEKVKARSYNVDRDNSKFELIINPTMNCNFKCWYCYETHVKDSKMDESTINSIIRFSENVINNQIGLEKFVLSFFGGEPLLYFEKVIKPILFHIYENCSKKNILFTAGMTTNGLLITEKVIIYCKKFGLNGFQITLDGNEEQHDKVRFISEGKGSYRKIIDNIKLVAQNGLHTIVRINCSADTKVDQIIEEFESLSSSEKANLTFDFQKVWQESEEIEKKLLNYRFNFIDHGYQVRSGLSDNINNSCYADKVNQATINYNGEVFKCTARDFTSGSGEGTLSKNGFIEWNSKLEKRMNSKFKNEPCKECRILPICGGGCSQAAIENENNDYCVMNFDEQAKTQLIIDEFTRIVR